MSDLFVPAGPHSYRVMCRICGVSGYPGSGKGWWTASHTSHPLRCSACGRYFTSGSGIANHIRLTRDPQHRQAATALVNHYSNAELLALAQDEESVD